MSQTPTRAGRSRSAPEKLHALATCVSWPPDDVSRPGGLCDMIETGRAVSRHHFRSLLAPGEMTRLEASLGYVQRRSQGLVMADDYHVRYFTGRLHGTRVAWVVHSAIEHVFAPRSFSFPEGVTS